MSRDSEPDPGHQGQNERLRRERDAAIETCEGIVSFLANLSHELRTPLNGMLGMVRLLGATELTLEQEGYIRSMRISGEHMLGIVNDVLDLAKLQNGGLTLEPAPANIAELVTSVLDILQPQANEKGIKLVRKIDPAVDTDAMVDPARLRQVLFNLAGNAVKFTDTGEVRIEAKCVAQDQRQISVLFRVVDTGVGISDADRARLFQRFTRARGVTREGAGLGLAISKELVQLMGGAIGVQSALGAGSTFWFRLSFPRAARAPERPSMRSEGHALASGALRLLLADDNHVNRLFIGTLLRKAGHDVTEVGDGRAAVAAVREGSFDAVLMDIHMPGMNGIEALNRIRALPGARAKIPVIALTADGLDGNRDRLLEAGMSDFIGKPIDVDELSAAIERCTGRAVAVPGINLDLPAAPEAPSPEAEAAVSDFLDRISNRNSTG